MGPWAGAMIMQSSNNNNNHIILMSPADVYMKGEGRFQFGRAEMRHGLKSDLHFDGLPRLAGREGLLFTSQRKAKLSMGIGDLFGFPLYPGKVEYLFWVFVFMETLNHRMEGISRGHVVQLPVQVHPCLNYSS